MYGVVFRDKDGVEHRVHLKKGNSEVIISAGALGSPQLLMLSGIGPSEELMSMGIRVIMNKPEVGKNMADNPMNPIFVPSFKLWVSPNMEPSLRHLVDMACLLRYAIISENLSINLDIRVKRLFHCDLFK